MADPMDDKKIQQTAQGTLQATQTRKPKQAARQAKQIFSVSGGEISVGVFTAYGIIDIEENQEMYIQVPTLNLPCGFYRITLRITRNPDEKKPDENPPAERDSAGNSSGKLILDVDCNDGVKRNYSFNEELVAAIGTDGAIKLEVSGTKVFVNATFEQGVGIFDDSVLENLLETWGFIKETDENLNWQNSEENPGKPPLNN